MTIHEEHIEISGNLIYTKKIQFNKSNNYIIFLHEGLGCTDQFKKFPEQLCRALNINGFAYDRRGYGRSSEYEFNDNPHYMHEEALHILPKIISHLKPDKFMLYGHSDGGTISLIYAGSHHRMPSVVVTEAAHSHREEIGVQGIIKTLNIYDTFLKKKLEKYHGDNTDNVFNGWSQNWLSDAFAKWNIFDSLEKIQCPVLVLQGGHDRYATAEHPEIIAGKINSYAKSVIIADADHAPHKENYKSVEKEVKVFLEETK